MIKSKNRILYIQYTNPAGYPPLEHSSRILAQADWEVLFLGTGASGADALRFPPYPHINVYQIPFCHPGWRQKLHYIRYSLWVLIWVLRWQPQWVYASDLLVCPLALILTFFPQVKVIYHEHDSPVNSSKRMFENFVLKTRNWLAKRAKICILPNLQRTRWFAENIGNEQNTICIWNCPRKDEVIQPLNSQKQNLLTLYYHGNISPTLLPISIIEAVSIVLSENRECKIKLRIVGYETSGNIGYLAHIKELAKNLGIQEQYMECISGVPRYKLLELAKNGDIGLALMPVNTSNFNLQYLTGASNKPFDYLACGLPLVVSDLPDWKQMYVEPGYGLACNPEDANSIADVIRWYLEHPLEMKNMGEKGRQRILHEWNYETQFEVVKNQL
jgi:glycosyltransferase involved in cell wall biosynthesis